MACAATVLFLLAATIEGLLVAFGGALLGQGRRGRRLDADAAVLRDRLGLSREQPWNWTRTASPFVSAASWNSSI